MQTLKELTYLIGATVIVTVGLTHVLPETVVNWSCIVIGFVLAGLILWQSRSVRQTRPRSSASYTWQHRLTGAGVFISAMSALLFALGFIEASQLGMIIPVGFTISLVIYLLAIYVQDSLLHRSHSLTTEVIAVASMAVGMWIIQQWKGDALSGLVLHYTGRVNLLIAGLGLTLLIEALGLPRIPSVQVRHIFRAVLVGFWIGVLITTCLGLVTLYGWLTRDLAWGLALGGSLVLITVELVETFRAVQVPEQTLTKAQGHQVLVISCTFSAALTIILLTVTYLR